jgi:rod shape-determining protein MreD
MNPYLAGAFLVGLVIVQSTVMPHAMIANTPPLLPVVAVVCWGILRGPLAAAWWALGLGILLDAVSFMPAGFYTLPMLAVAGVVALVGRRLFENNLLLPLGLTVAATLVYTLVQYGLLSLGSTYAPMSAEALARVTVPVVVLNLLWLPALFFLLRAISGWSGQPRIGWER